MVKIKIVLFGRFMPFHWLSHIAAVVTDMSTDQSFKIHYPFPSHAHLIDNLKESMYGKAKDSYSIATVELYSNKNFTEFLRAYAKRSDEQYSYLFNNCANHVEFVLDYFCPDTSTHWNLFFDYLLNLNMMGLLTLGCSLFPLAPFVFTPRDVFNKAYSLSFFYNASSITATNDELPRTTDEVNMPVTRVEDEANDNDRVEYLVRKHSLIQ